VARVKATPEDPVRAEGGRIVQRKPKTNMTSTSRTRRRTVATPYCSTARGEAAKQSICDMEEWSQRLRRAGKK
jgi:hypothetical protein